MPFKDQTYQDYALSRNQFIDYDLIDSLPNGKQVGETNNRVVAYLIDEKEGPLSTNFSFRFMINPEQLQYVKEVVYSPANAFGASVPSQQYYYTKGKELNLSNVLLDGWSYGKKINGHLDNLYKLTVPDIEKGSRVPPVLSFRWGGGGNAGSGFFEPCVITKISQVDSHWFTGESARARLNITLLQVPPPNEDPTFRGAIPIDKLIEKYNSNKPVYETNSTNNATGSSTPDPSKYPLTDRQASDAQKATKDYINANKNRILPAIISFINRGDYAVVINKANGDINVSLLTKLGDEFISRDSYKDLKIGTYNPIPDKSKNEPYITESSSTGKGKEQFWRAARV